MFPYLQLTNCYRFSRRSILDFIHIIYRHVDTLCVRMQAFEARAEPLNLSHAFPALTGDIIMDYFFGFNYNQLRHPEFESFHDAFIKIGGVGKNAHVRNTVLQALTSCHRTCSHAISIRDPGMYTYKSFPELAGKPTCDLGS
jgi:hypothetical protein